MVKIIAEICQNHNGSLENLLTMASEAHASGAQFAKIQALYSNELVHREEFETLNDNRFNMYRPFKSELNRLSTLDLNLEQERAFVLHCEQIGITPMITVFTDKGLIRAIDSGFHHLKIASYDCTNFSLITSCLKQVDHLYISTGAATMVEVESLTTLLSKYSKQKKITLLHCKTEYPNKLNSVNLNRMLWLANFNFPVGFSDHTQTYDDAGRTVPHINLASKIAIYKGANVIERHFSTIDPTKTKDGKISINSKNLSELVNFASKNSEDQQRELNISEDLVREIMGDFNFEPSVEEWWNRRYYKGRVRSND